MSELDMDKIVPILKSMGLSPDQIGQDKMKLVERLADSLTDPTADPSQLLRDLGLNFGEKAIPRTAEKRVKRNAKCPCNSGKKYKACCLPTDS